MGLVLSIAIVCAIGASATVSVGLGVTAIFVSVGTMNINRNGVQPHLSPDLNWGY